MKNILKMLLALGLISNVSADAEQQAFLETEQQNAKTNIAQDIIKSEITAKKKAADDAKKVSAKKNLDTAISELNKISSDTLNAVKDNNTKAQDAASKAKGNKTLAEISKKSQVAEKHMSNLSTAIKNVLDAIAIVRSL